MTSATADIPTLSSSVYQQVQDNDLDFNAFLEALMIKRDIEEGNKTEAQREIDLKHWDDSAIPKSVLTAKKACKSLPDSDFINIQ